MLGGGGQHVEITLSESPAECWVILNCVGGVGRRGHVEITLSESSAEHLVILNCVGGLEGGVGITLSESPAECLVILYIVLRDLNDYWVFVLTSQKD